MSNILKALSTKALDEAYHFYCEHGENELRKKFPTISEKDFKDLISYFEARRRKEKEALEKNRKESKAKAEKAKRELQEIMEAINRNTRIANLDQYSL